MDDELTASSDLHGSLSLSLFYFYLQTLTQGLPIAVPPTRRRRPVTTGELSRLSSSSFNTPSTQTQKHKNDVVLKKG